MKTLHSYLTRQILASLLMTVMVFTFVLLIGNVLKEILPVLVSGQVSFGVAASAIGLLVPFVWVFALPMGMLTATLLIFGRFSADQEYTAVRASGVSLLTLVSPILLLSLGLCAVSALVNMEIGPRCRVAYTTMFANLRARLSSTILPEGHYISIKDYLFYVGKNRKGAQPGVSDLQDVIVLPQSDTNNEQAIHAPRGRLEVDTANKQINLTLYDGKLVPLRGEGAREGMFGSLLIQIPLEPPDKAREAKIDDMTFFQLWDELGYWEQRINSLVPLEHLSKEQVLTRKKERDQLRRNWLMPVVFQLHRQVAFSFACFGFTLLGIPLGLRMHRRETNVGIAIALLLVALYYSFILIGQSLQNKPEFAPHLFVWMPNFLFQGVGALLLWRANRGAG